MQTARTIKLQGAISGNVKFDGSEDVTITTTQANIAIVTGNINMVDGEGVSEEISLPSDFTSDNSVVLSAMFHGSSDVSKFAYGYLEKSTAYVAGAIGHSITLTSTNKLKIVIGNPVSSNSGSRTFTFKIILLKIS